MMKKLFAFASIAMLMFSCSENIEETPLEEKLPISISVDVQTRANDNSFDDGDAVGIYVVNYDGSTAGTLKDNGNQADNTEFVYNGGGWNTSTPIYWKDKNTTADFYAYYPYSNSANIDAHPFNVKEDQSNEANFWASDFLWGKTTKVAPSSNAVGIQVNHVLSRMVIKIKPGNGFTSEDWKNANKSVTIANVLTDATINLATGIATATGVAGSITPWAKSSTYEAMIIPQTVAADTKLIVITVNGTNYVYRTGHTFEANVIHTFSVTISKTDSNVDVSIGTWMAESTIHNGTAIEEEKAAPIPNNEIWYTTTDGNIVTSPTSGTFYNQKSNTYADGKGVIVFNSNVTSISSNQFKSLTKLESVVIPDSVTEIGISSFSGCSSLKSATLGSGLKYIDENAFSDCTALVEIYCKATTPPSVENQAALGGLYTANKKIYVPTSSVDAYKKAQNWSSYSSMIVGYDF